MQKELLKNDLNLIDCRLNYSELAIANIHCAICDIESDNITEDQLKTYIEEMLSSYEIIYYDEAFNYLKEIKQYNFDDAFQAGYSLDICSIASYYLYSEMLDVVNELFRLSKIEA